MTVLWVFIKRFWFPIAIGIVVILGFAIWVQLCKETNFFAKWAFDFVTQWAIVLSASVTLILAFATFWVISDTRHFRYLDDKTKVITDLNNWAADVVRCLSIPARYIADKTELRKNLIDCRTELMIKVAQSIGIFAAAYKLSTDIRINKRKELKEALDDTDQELRNFISILFEIDIEKVTKEDIDRVANGAASITGKARKILEITSQI